VTAERFQVDAKTVRKWRERFLTEGPSGLLDRSSLPHRPPNDTPDECRHRIIELRKSRRWGAAHIGFEVGRAASTVQKLAGIPDGGGWRIHGRGNTPTTPRSTTGYPYLHSALDDRTRLVYSEIHSNEQAVTAVAFWQRANIWFNTHNITVERVLSDNGPCYLSRLWRNTLTDAGITPKFTRPFRPQTNGKIERFHRILLEEWVYIRDWHNDQQRTTHYDHFLNFYNHHRAHGALGWSTPIATLKDNLPVMHT
jgi:transposase InsO family protein